MRLTSVLLPNRPTVPPRFGMQQPNETKQADPVSAEVMQAEVTAFMSDEDDRNTLFSALNQHFFQQLTQSTDDTERRAIRNDIVVENQRMVYSIVNKWWHIKFPNRVPFHDDADYQDLVAEGNMGLLRAIDKFEPERGNQFSTYACWWIMQFVRRGARQAGKLINTREGNTDTVNHLKRLQARLSEYTRERVSPEQTVDYYLALQKLLERKLRMEDIQTLPINMDYLRLGLSVKPDQKTRLLQCLQADRQNRKRVSLDLKVGKTEDTSLQALVGDNRVMTPVQIVAREESRKRLMAMLELIPVASQAKIFALRTGLLVQPFTTEVLGKLYGVSRQWIDQIEKKTLKCLQEMQTRAFINPLRQPLRSDLIEPAWKIIEEKGMASLTRDERMALVLFFGADLPVSQIARLGGQLEDGTNRLGDDDVSQYIQSAFKKVLREADEATSPDFNIPGFFNPDKLQSKKFQLWTPPVVSVEEVPLVTQTDLQTEVQTVEPLLNTEPAPAEVPPMAEPAILSAPVAVEQAPRSESESVPDSGENPDPIAMHRALLKQHVAAKSPESGRKRNSPTFSPRRTNEARRTRHYEVIDVPVPAYKSSVEPEVRDAVGKFSTQEQVILGYAWRLFDAPQPSPEELAAAAGMTKATMYRVRGRVLETLKKLVSPELVQQYDVVYAPPPRTPKAGTTPKVKTERVPQPRKASRKKGDPLPEIHLPAVKPHVSARKLAVLKTFNPQEQLILGNALKFFEELAETPEALAEATGLSRATLYRDRTRLLVEFERKLTSSQPEDATIPLDDPAEGLQFTAIPSSQTGSGIVSA